jgi:hypothetical protein
MAKGTNEEAEIKRRRTIERMWLHSFNDSRLKKGLITTAQHQKMKIQINSRRASASE